jgi:hypothetical protein
MGGAVRRGVALAVALALGGTTLVAAPRPAMAQSPSDQVRTRLDEGKRLFAELEYRAAIRELEPVRADPAATRAQRLTALEIIGISLLILGERKEAVQAFEDLVAIDPGYALQHDDGSPKIRELFDQVRARATPGFEAGGEVELEHDAPPGATAAQRVEVEAVVKRGVDRVKAMVLRWRRRGVLDYQDAAMAPAGDGRYRGSFTPPPSRSRYEVDYYVEARNAAGGALGRIGGPDSPLALSVEPGVSEAPPWYGRWYVIAGGVVAAGLVTGLVIVASDGGAPDGSLGRVTLK